MIGLLIACFPDDINMTECIYTDWLRSLAKFKIFPPGCGVYIVYVCIYTYCYIRTLSSCAKITTLQHTILEHSQQTPLCVFMSLPLPSHRCAVGLLRFIFLRSSFESAAKVCSPAGDEVSANSKRFVRQPSYYII